MKFFILICVVLITSYSNVFSQCADPGLKIESGACEDPKNLKIVSASCSELNIQWLGNKKQTYKLKASYVDPGTNKVVELKTTQITADNIGNFKASVNVKEGANVSWSVQAVCSIENATFYSAEIKGADAYISICRNVNAPVLSKAINIYPNPSVGYINVEYSGKANETVLFRVMEVTGKKVLNKFESTATGANNRYTFDLRSLPPGTYLLEAVTGKKTEQARFVLLRN